MARFATSLTRLGAVAALALGLAAGAATAAAEEASMASVTRGGRLYDNWVKELHQPPPEAANPAWPATAAKPADAARTWLCVECHGWTYRGVPALKTPGIAGMAGGEPARIIDLLKTPGHGYGEVLHQRDLEDLAAFIAQGQSHLVADIDPMAKPDGESHGAVYQTVCARCHGGDGKQVESIPPLGDVARENPWMVMHNILNGHAGGVMPSLRALDEALALDTLAALRELPATEPAAAIARGGRLYGDWIKETGRTAPRTVHPAWTGKAPASASDTWRCRDCHGWDYQGKDGPAAKVSPVPARGLALQEGAPAEAIIAILTNDTHRYGGVLTRRDLADLAAFVSGGQFRMTWAIDPDKASFHGEGLGYGDHYQTLCASCHGATGTAVRTMSPLGRVVRENPWRALHNVLNGHAGESMPPMRVFPPDMAAAILAHIERTLPSER
ncbi:c-type cytochrome [Novispirillum sp. DQ9]|uniref:c-type cytochrome n=1 Tax=Novispirillum sp. DQ9 TaxID=3398612 RepID=UPI003C79C188